MLLRPLSPIHAGRPTVARDDHAPAPPKQLERDGGPVAVQTIYTISPEREETFLHLMAQVRLSRLRTGATRWRLYRDAESEHRFVELFVVGSWDEHLRQHAGRYTGFDQDIERRASALSDPAPQTSHLITADVP